MFATDEECIEVELEWRRRINMAEAQRLLRDVIRGQEVVYIEAYRVRNYGELHSRLGEKRTFETGSFNFATYEQLLRLLDGPLAGNREAIETTTEPISLAKMTMYFHTYWHYDVSVSLRENNEEPRIFACKVSAELLDQHIESTTAEPIEASTMSCSSPCSPRPCSPTLDDHHDDFISALFAPMSITRHVDADVPITERFDSDHEAGVSASSLPSTPSVGRENYTPNISTNLNDRAIDLKRLQRLIGRVETYEMDRSDNNLGIRFYRKIYFFVTLPQHRVRVCLYSILDEFGTVRYEVGVEHEFQRQKHESLQYSAIVAVLNSCSSVIHNYVYPTLEYSECPVVNLATGWTHENNSSANVKLRSLANGNGAVKHSMLYSSYVNRLLTHILTKTTTAGLAASSAFLLKLKIDGTRMFGVYDGAHHLCLDNGTELDLKRYVPRCTNYRELFSSDYVYQLERLGENGDYDYFFTDVMAVRNRYVHNIQPPLHGYSAATQRYRRQPGQEWPFNLVGTHFAENALLNERLAAMKRHTCMVGAPLLASSRTSNDAPTNLDKLMKTAKPLMSRRIAGNNKTTGTPTTATTNNNCSSIIQSLATWDKSSNSTASHATASATTTAAVTNDTAAEATTTTPTVTTTSAVQQQAPIGDNTGFVSITIDESRVMLDRLAVAIERYSLDRHTRRFHVNRYHEVQTLAPLLVERNFGKHQYIGTFRELVKLFMNSEADDAVLTKLIEKCQSNMLSEEWSSLCNSLTTADAASANDDRYAWFYELDTTTMFPHIDGCLLYQRTHRSRVHNRRCTFASLAYANQYEVYKLKSFQTIELMYCEGLDAHGACCREFKTDSFYQSNFFRHEASGGVLTDQWIRFDNAAVSLYIPSEFLPLVSSTVYEILCENADTFYLTRMRRDKSVPDTTFKVNSIVFGRTSLDEVLMPPTTHSKHVHRREASSKLKRKIAKKRNEAVTTAFDVASTTTVEADEQFASDGDEAATVSVEAENSDIDADKNSEIANDDDAGNEDDDDDDADDNDDSDGDNDADESWYSDMDLLAASPLEPAISRIDDFVYDD